MLPTHLINAKIEH